MHSCRAVITYTLRIFHLPPHAHTHTHTHTSKRNEKYLGDGNSIEFNYVSAGLVYFPFLEGCMLDVGVSEVGATILSATNPLMALFISSRHAVTTQVWHCLTTKGL